MKKHGLLIERHTGRRRPREHVGQVATIRTGPKEVDGHKVEGFWRAHQVPMAEMHENPTHLALLEEWLRSYCPQELFDEAGRFVPELRDLAQKERRMGANPHANGGLLRRG
jgi:xylulose-5-phosphate/fructose-6-phosphate phosphoketolase